VRIKEEKPSTQQPKPVVKHIKLGLDEVDIIIQALS
jgi:hypothetical protein